MRLHLTLILAAVAIAFCAGSLFLSFREMAAQPRLGAPSVRRVKDQFVGQSHPEGMIDIETLYPSREKLALIDPGRALPDFQRYPLADLTVLYRYAKTCVGGGPGEKIGAELRKAWVWQSFECGQLTQLPAHFFDRPPFLHPSGASYAALASREFPSLFGTPEWLRDHELEFHLGELPALRDRIRLQTELSMLADLGPSAWRALAAGSSFVVGEGFVLVRQDQTSEPHSQSPYLVFSRKDWDRQLASTPYRVVPQHPGEDCQLAEEHYCWNIDPHRVLSFANASVLAALVTLVFLTAIIVWILQKRLAQEKADEERRRFILQTLTHELRTPLSTIVLTLETFQKEYDRLGDAGKHAYAALCDEVQRLQRLADRSRQYLLTRGRELIAMSWKELPSFNEFLERVMEPYPDVKVSYLTVDQSFRTDPYWLMICLRNLIENARHHGRPPIQVMAVADQRRLRIAVIDAGKGPAGSLRSLTRPFAKRDESPGLGLGLSIVSRVVEEMQGKLAYSTEPTTFQVELEKAA